MKTLSDIQDKVRIYTNDSKLTLTDNTTDKNRGLDISNEVYLRLTSIYDWPEFNRVDTSISTVTGTQSYNWPNSPKFMNILNIEIQNEFGDYENIPGVMSELDWSNFNRMDNSFPRVYRFESSGEQKKISFAPTPSSDSTVRIRGIIEPTEFINGDSETIFYNKIADNVLEYLIAASILFKRGVEDKALNRLRQASSFLRNLTGKEIMPEELDPRANQVELNAS